MLIENALLYPVFVDNVTGNHFHCASWKKNYMRRDKKLSYGESQNFYIGNRGNVKKR